LTSFPLSGILLSTVALVGGLTREREKMANQDESAAIDKYNAAVMKLRLERNKLVEAMKQIDDVLLGHMPVTAAAKDIARAVLKEIGEA
jgi:hypothetical protein